MFHLHLVDLWHMVAGRTHAVDELAIVGEQQHSGGVLVQATHGLHALHRRLLGSQPQWRRQQGVDAGVGRGLLRTFGGRRFVQHDVGLLEIRPVHALNPETQSLCYKFRSCLRTQNGR